MKDRFRLIVLLILTLVAVTAAAQGTNQAAKSPSAARENATSQPNQPATIPSAELFPTPDVPPENADSPPRSQPNQPATIPNAELFPTPDVPPENADNPPRPLTAAEIELQAQIQNAISKDPSLSGGAVNVAISEDGIELSGTVATVRARLAASRLARSYAGSRKVFDKITVAARSSKSATEPAKAEPAGTTRLHP